MATITIYINPAKTNIIPPTISYFHDIINTINNINARMLCINKPIIISLVVAPGINTSSENNAKNIINNIDKILGVQ